ncbi:MAG TPA: flagellar biosynthesis protein FlgA [Nitrospinae bacterium]|nr:flagellar biosynthesis protein FlgA [Nitrospinota bacterium]
MQICRWHRRFRLAAIVSALVLGVMVFLSGTAKAVRLKDIATVKGVRSNQLIGYGLVVGLNGTGDGNDPSFTAQSLSSFLKKLGINTPASSFNVKNVAAVALTADLPPFARVGSRVDVTVSTIGDAKSLLGGTLLLSPLRGVDGEVYVVVQGAVSLGGGFAFAGATGTGVQRNHPTVGLITNGGSVEKEIRQNFWRQKAIRLALNSPDFTTVSRVVTAINGAFGDQVAQARDSGTVDINLRGIAKNAVQAIAQIERIEVVTDRKAIVVINERTGTIVMGENVRISTVAISHGNLNIVIREDSLVSQPEAFAPDSAQTQIIPKTEITVTQEKRSLVVLQKTVSIGDVVRGLNAIGVSPRDLIAILQALKGANALDAEIKLI